MEKLNIMVSTAVPLPIEDIDTDQIIPARFLKSVSKEGFGQNLFRDWRYNQDGTIINDFILNNDKYKGKILVAGKNFGCGSSREHAAWSLADYGFKVVISSFFADIFRGNALNNGILPLQVNQDVLNNIFQILERDHQTLLEVNVDAQTLNVGQINVSFDIDPYKKVCLINGYDDIDYLISIKEEIESFEKKRIFTL
ncbi:MAG: 3-isopropylmalate dehydratase small subunit [Saprospiraceae bacterium]|nr:3-isopropylmalate dehydratase small subunit [Saprospiraceae bacterium]